MAHRPWRSFDQNIQIVMCRQNSTATAGATNTAGAGHAVSDFHQQGKALVIQQNGLLAGFPSAGIAILETDQQDVSSPCHRLSVTQALTQCVAPDSLELRRLDVRFI